MREQLSIRTTPRLFMCLSSAVDWKASRREDINSKEVRELIEKMTGWILYVSNYFKRAHATPYTRRPSTTLWLTTNAIRGMQDFCSFPGGTMLVLTQATRPPSWLASLECHLGDLKYTPAWFRLSLAYTLLLSANYRFHCHSFSRSTTKIRSIKALSWKVW